MDTCMEGQMKGYTDGEDRRIDRQLARRYLQTDILRERNREKGVGERERG